MAWWSESGWAWTGASRLPPTAPTRLPRTSRTIVNRRATGRMLPSEASGHVVDRSSVRTPLPIAGWGLADAAERTPWWRRRAAAGPCATRRSYRLGWGRSVTPQLGGSLAAGMFGGYLRTPVDFAR